MEKLIYEKSVSGRQCLVLPDAGVLVGDVSAFFPKEYLRKENSLALPEVSELDAMRHFVRLSQLNHSIDTGFYPLGSCTMKYNPKINDQLAQLEGFR